MSAYWFNAPLPSRAPAGGTTSRLNGKSYRGGQFMPFYVPRATMPQVDESALPALITYLTAAGAAPAEETVPWTRFHPHQRISRLIAGAMSSAVRAKPILVSEDGFILDGNHRWAAHKAEDSTITAFRVPLPFTAAAALICTFPGSYTLGSGHPQTN